MQRYIVNVDCAENIFRKIPLSWHNNASFSEAVRMHYHALPAIQADQVAERVLVLYYSGPGAVDGLPGNAVAVVKSHSDD